MSFEEVVDSVGRGQCYGLTATSCGKTLHETRLERESIATLDKN